MKKGSTKFETENRCYMNCPVKTVNIVQTTILLVMSWKWLALEKEKMMLVFGVCTKKRTNIVLKLKNIIEIINSINYFDSKR